MTRHTSGLIVGLAALLGGGMAAAAPAAEPPRLRVLMVLDSSDPALAPGVKRDRESVERFLAAHLPAARYTLDAIDGTAITPARVLDYYKTLAVAPADALLFYYSGHGSVRPDLGHTLELKRGKAPLARAAVKKAMAEKGARLTVLLTDCCSDRFPHPGGPGERSIGKPAGPDAPTPLAARLFFDPRGVIDLTAADNDVAYADDFRGGYFTCAVCAVAGRNKARPVEWREFAAAVQAETTAIHKRAIDEGTAPKLRSGERHQQPTAVEPLPAAAAAAVTAVIGLTNPGAAPIEIEYRWSDAQPWTKITLPAGGKRALGARIHGDPADAPALRVKINEKEQALPAKVWENEGTPKFSDGKIYRFATKPAGKTAAARSLVADDPPAGPEADDPPAVGIAPAPAR